MKKLRTFLIIGIFLYAGIGALLYFFQERFLFHPIPLAPNHTFNFPQSFREINLAVDDNKNLSLVQFTVPDSTCKGVVLYFHGNRNNIERYAGYASNFTKNNYEVWMCDYPGFGKSTGNRSETILYADALMIYNMARAKFPKERIIIYGKSLGTGIASQLASVRNCEQLILETPYYNIAELFGHYAFMYPAALLAKYQLPTNEYLKKVNVPITILHGTDDEVIPFAQAKRLKKDFPQINLFTVINGKHNNLNDFLSFRQKLDSLLRR